MGSVEKKDPGKDTKEDCTDRGGIERAPIGGFVVLSKSRLTSCNISKKELRSSEEGSPSMQ
jgi:hypothetical protein